MASPRSFRSASRRIHSPATCCLPRQDGDTLKILFLDCNGLCLFSKRLDQGGFIWPRMSDPGRTVMLSPAQLAMPIEGIDWRTPEHRWRRLSRPDSQQTSIKRRESASSNSMPSRIGHAARPRKSAVRFCSVRSAKGCSECSLDVAPSAWTTTSSRSAWKISTAMSRIEEEQLKGIPEATTTQPRRRALPDHLPRDDVRLGGRE